MTTAAVPRKTPKVDLDAQCQQLLGGGLEHESEGVGGRLAEAARGRWAPDR